MFRYLALGTLLTLLTVASSLKMSDNKEVALKMAGDDNRVALKMGENDGLIALKLGTDDRVALKMGGDGNGYA